MANPILSVIFEDGVIVKDGNPKFGFVFPGVDPNWTALQWYGTHGWIDVNLGERIWLDNGTIQQDYSDMYDVAGS